MIAKVNFIIKNSSLVLKVFVSTSAFSSFFSKPLPNVHRKCSTSFLLSLFSSFVVGKGQGGALSLTNGKDHS